MGLYPGALSSDELVMSDCQNVKDLDKPTSYEPQPPSPPPRPSRKSKPRTCADHLASVNSSAEAILPERRREGESESENHEVWRKSRQGFR